MLLSGKTAIITGAARGIGRQIALLFAKEGCNVAITYIVSSEPADEVLLRTARRQPHRIFPATATQLQHDRITIMEIRLAPMPCHCRNRLIQLHLPRCALKDIGEGLHLCKFL